MRRRSLLVVLGFAVGAPGSAQQWTTEQSDVLAFAEGCWVGWTRAVEAHDNEVWRSACRPTEDLKWWWMPDPVPETAATLDRQFAWQVEHIERVVWWDVRPISVDIVGDVAAVMFYAEGSWIGTDGEPVDFGSKRLELFRRDGSTWAFMGGMVSPTSPSSR